MCGRYYRRSDKQKIAEHFRVRPELADVHLPGWSAQATDLQLAPSYNIAPTTFQPIILADRDSGNRALAAARWGLIPPSERDPQHFKTYTTSNARAETIIQKGIWSAPFKHSRCLIPLDGFYEWLQKPPLPQPGPDLERGLFGTPVPVIATKKPPKPKPSPKPAFRFYMPNEKPYALAGLFSTWHGKPSGVAGPSMPNPDWNGLLTFSIITCEANELMAPIHNRMPVILHARDYDRWLFDYDQHRLPLDLLRPYESDKMRMTPASPLVGNVRNNGPEMLNSA
jgi:putative SOS response-associated peptidase YedK